MTGQCHDGSLLSDTSVENPVVVVGKLGRNTSVLVDLPGLGDDSGGLLVQLARDSLVLADDLVTDSVVEGLEEVEESGRDTLLF